MALAIDDNDTTNETLLMHETARYLRCYFDRKAEHLGLTRAQWQLLAVVRRNPGINQSQLACRLELEPITLTRHLDRMEQGGWIERRADPHDRRANLIYLSGKAGGIVAEMRKVALSVRRDALKGFSEKDRQTLLSYLKRMKDNVGALIGKEGAE